MKYSVARVTTSLFYHFCAVKFTLIRSTGMARWSHLCREHFRVTSCQEVIPPSCVLYYEALSGYLNWVGISLAWSEFQNPLFHVLRRNQCPIDILLLFLRLSSSLSSYNPSLCCLSPFHCLMLQFQGHVTCQNFTLKRPQYALTI